MRRLPAIFLVLLLISPVSSLVAQTPQAPINVSPPLVSDVEKQQWETLKKRFELYGRDYIMSFMWTLIHDYRSKSQVDEALNLMQVLTESLAKDDSSGLRSIGGPEGFNNRFLKLMAPDDDDTVAGFSARVLAVCGGLRYAPQIAALMNRRDESWTNEHVYPAPKSRGQAAIALSILETNQYTDEIAALLQSQNIYDRSGANFALGHLRATKYAREIANLLLRKEFTFRRDASPIYALIEMGVASEYKTDIAQVLDDDFSELLDPAVYALAHLRAKEYSPKIAKLLNHKYRRATASKALAIMGAKEYAGKIASILADNNSLDQSAALLALGILKATQYAPNAATLMRTKRSSYVSVYAAVSLVLMGSTRYAREAIAVLKAHHKSGPYIDAGDLSPLVAEEARELNQQFLAALEQLKSRR